MGWNPATTGSLLTGVQSSSGTYTVRELGISVKPLAFLDARPMQNGDAQFVDAVVQSLQTLSDDGVLKLLATNEPDSLAVELADRGYRITSCHWREDAWDIEISAPHTPDIADLRGMEAPEPLHHVLTAASQLEGDKTCFARLPHVPHPLFPLLRERGLRWWVHEELDQSALLAVRANC